MKIKYEFLLSYAVDRFLEPSQILHLIRTTESVCTPGFQHSSSHDHCNFDAREQNAEVPKTTYISEIRQNDRGAPTRVPCTIKKDTFTSRRV